MRSGPGDMPMWNGPIGGVNSFDSPANLGGLGGLGGLQLGSPTGLQAPQTNGVPGFDAQFYLQQNPDVAQNWTGDPMLHYLMYGMKEGRQPSGNPLAGQNQSVGAWLGQPQMHTFDQGMHPMGGAQFPPQPFAQPAPQEQPAPQAPDFFMGGN